MIDRREILAEAERLTLLPNVVEKDYVLGWMLAGIYAHPDISEDIRGSGLMMGIKCKVPNTALQAAAMDEHLLTIGAGDNVIRLLPPLVVTDADIADAVNRLDRACRALEARAA